MTDLLARCTLSMRVFYIVSSVLAFVVLVPPDVMAQTTVLTAAVSGYTATSPGATIPDTAFVPITVTRNDGAAHLEASGQGGTFSTACTVPCPYPPAVTQAFAGGFASADPGVLRVFASDLAAALPALNAPNVPVTPNNNTVYANISAAASFQVFLTVGSSTLPVGTSVQIPFHFVVQLTASTELGYPAYSEHPLTVSAQFTFPGLGTFNFSTDDCDTFCGFETTDLPDGSVFYSLRSVEFLVDAKVGDVMPISAALGMSGSPRVVNGNNTNGNGDALGR